MRTHSRPPRTPDLLGCMGIRQTWTYPGPCHGLLQNRTAPEPLPVYSGQSFVCVQRSCPAQYGRPPSRHLRLPDVAVTKPYGDFRKRTAMAAGMPSKQDRMQRGRGLVSPPILTPRYPARTPPPYARIESEEIAVRHELHADLGHCGVKSTAYSRRRVMVGGQAIRRILQSF